VIASNDMPSNDSQWMIPVALILAVESCLWMVAFAAGLAPLPPVIPYIPFFVPGLILVLGYYAALAGRRSEFAAFRERLGPALAGAMMMLLGFGLLTAFKTSIPALNPFWLDQTLATAERAIFGTDPWRITHAVLGGATRVIDVFYALWFPLQSIVLCAILFQPPSEHKTRALISYALFWILLGIVAAVLLSSVGPIFYDRLTGSSEFAGLEEIGAPIARTMSDMLWTAYTTHSTNVGNGISAAPSLHVAIAAWTALALRNRLMWLYVAAIWVASVHLGWHYVFDGLAGIAGALAIWRVAPKLAPGNLGRLRVATA